MKTRSDQLLTFIQANGWGQAARELLAGDASNRRYDRLIDIESNRAAVLMDAPPEKGESVADFIRVGQMLLGFGFSAPEIYAADEKNGFLLLEDLGDALVARVCQANPILEPEMYEVAVDILVQLHTKPAPRNLPDYDLAWYLKETRLLTEWYVPVAAGGGLPAIELENYDSLVKEMCTPILQEPRVLTQRDYHAENLLWLPDRIGLKRLGLLDFQGAMTGHPAYDLVSLLEDARRDTSDTLQADMKARYLKASNTDPSSFNYAYSALGAQRNLKILGIFTRLAVQDGKFTYLDLIPRVWTHLQRDLSHPDLTGLKNWVDKNVPVPTADLLNKVKEEL